ncbi:hypothetical protein [Pseudodonghicola flavimaris]|uniref:Uncharacterized protein n=1 Tax=Pseudodonghicola flavimaris TaxID=3050036 RepID=A0ABT7F4E3_9RHOB|nr:hypothetical protein [Pseudodonghicola flavimaris]MDK3019479.1 hypothetical protein [Pseudodonghicola flavimaris]
MDEEILAVIEVSPLRRAFGIAVLVCFGAVLIYVALATPPAPGWQLFLIAVGGLSLWMADRMRRATAQRLELTATALRDDAGLRIVEIADIAGLERGTFAFKPSNGFVIRTRSGAARHWRPGLWWRLGRRVGVGGVTSAPQTKAMAQIIEAMLLERGEG